MKKYNNTECPRKRISAIIFFIIRDLKTGTCDYNSKYIFKTSGSQAPGLFKASNKSYLEYFCKSKNSQNLHITKSGENVDVLLYYFF